jgi:hypothetical protein
LKPPPIDWVHGYSDADCESHNHAGVQTTDGGYFLVGDGQCYNTQTPFSRQVVAAKINATGGLEWLVNVGDIGYNYGKFGMQLDDASFVIGGALSVKADNKRGYTECRALIRVTAQGKIASKQVFPNELATQDGKVDGIMGLSLTPENGVLVATGYMHSDLNGYDDQPMFLIWGGFAFAMQLSYTTDPSDPFTVRYERLFNSSEDTRGFTLRQGMRLSADDNGYTISAMACADPSVANFALIRRRYNS